MILCKYLISNCRIPFWHNIDPTTLNGRFADHGTQYRTGIFFHTNDQEEATLPDVMSGRWPVLLSVFWRNSNAKLVLFY
ncbi:MAG: peptide-methionine (S)-S-oxide reductase [Candidatus Anammoxibacter sp.]